MALIKFSAGDWFAVPLGDGRFATGVVTVRSPGKGGVLLGYFFGPPFDHLPNLPEIQENRPADAVLVGHFGYLGIRSGNWPLLGQAGDWKIDDWPNPAFIREEGRTGRYFRVFYDDTDPNRVLREELLAADDSAEGPSDGLMGHMYVESVLAKLFA